MPCSHTLSALLASTNFAKDGPAMRRSRKAVEKHQTETLRYINQVNQDLSRHVINSTWVDNTVHVQQHREQPTFDQHSVAKVTDRGRLLDPISALCRDYSQYNHDHTDVYNAIVSLFGTRTFDSDAVPSDALAFATLAAFIITVADRTGLNTNVPNQIRAMATIAASIASVNHEYLNRLTSEILKSTAQQQEWRGAYDLLLIGNDKVSTLVTELTWLVMSSIAKLSKERLSPCTDSFLEYVASSKAVPCSSADRLSITARGEFVVSGKTYEASGYCRDGVILKKIRDVVDYDVHMFPFDECLSRTMEHYNAKCDRSVCAGCSLQLVTENGRLYKYENSLCSADLTTAQNVKVHIDGSVDFMAQTFLIDKRTDKVLRTGLRKHKCDLYDMHMLGGFDIRNCQQLSSLFQVAERAICCDIECNGVSVWATVERMDSYELDKSGRVTSINHGKTTKFANQDGDRMRWGLTADGSGFTIDDVVE